MLRALRHAGERGLSSTAFLLPDVCDGGAPVLRVASRIAELRGDGYAIETRRDDGRSTVSYHLTAVPERKTPLTDEPSRRIEVAPPFTPPAASPFDPWENVA